MIFRIRIEADLPCYDDAAEIAKFAHLNGTQFEAATYEEATSYLRSLGLDAGHGIGVTATGWAYPNIADKDTTKVWHLTGAATRTRLGNNCKLAQLYNLKKVV